MDWQSRRRRLNHDRIKNGVRLKLAAGRNMLLGKVGPEMSLLPDVQHCEQLLSDVTILLDTFVVEMSPRFLFTQPFLSNCSPWTRSWLPDALHHRWLTSSEIATLVDRTKHLIEEAAAALQKLLDEVRTYEATREAQARMLLLEALDVFLAALDALSASVSRFPDRMPLR
jgi:hypothetical protein